MNPQISNKVTAVLLNWNGYDHTSACLKSLADVSWPQLKILVVDNASTDDSPVQLQQTFPDVEIILNRENLGFAAGCNVGIKHALGAGTDYILLLNNDTLVDPGFLEPLVEMAQSRPGIGAVGGKIYKASEPDVIWDAGGFIDWLKGCGRRRGSGQVDQGQHDQPTPVGFVTGCMMLVKVDVFAKAGLLPEVYFFGVEEWEYGLQVRRAGYELWYTPESKIWHKVGGSNDGLDPAFFYNYLRSRLLFMRRNAPPAWYPIWYTYFRLHLAYAKRIKYPRLFKDSTVDVTKLAQAIDLAVTGHYHHRRVTRRQFEQARAALAV